MNDLCTFEHPHPEHPCGRRIVPGVTTCAYCGNLDDSAECKAAGCRVRLDDKRPADLKALFATADLSVDVRQL